MHEVREKDFGQEAAPNRREDMKAFDANVCHSCREFVALWKTVGC